MKKIIPMLCLALLYATPASADTESKKNAFYLALSNISSDIATYTFLLDELLLARCKVAPSVEYLSASTDDYNTVLVAFKSGNTQEAKKLLAEIPCEESVKREAAQTN